MRDRSRPARRRRLGPATQGIAVGLVIVLLASSVGLLTSSDGAAAVAGAGSNGAGVDLEPLPATTYNSTLTVNTSSVNLSSQFWGTTVNNEVHMFRGETNAVNATPAHVLVWPGAMAGEDYNPLTETHYNTYDGTPTHALTNESQFVQMCEAIRCTAIVQVPAEIDDASLAEAIVNYTEQNLSFVPAYWMIGNEPELWQHWKVPWSKWGTQYTTGPTPTQFGDEVVAYVDAIRQVDNTTPILGLPASGCTCGYYTFDQWISGVLKVTGDKIQAVAFHEYPAGWLGTGDGSLLDFYATLQGKASIPVRMVAARQAIASACPGCNVSVFISEIGAALSWSAYGPYADAFSGALSLASQMTQGMASNVSNIDLFATSLATTNSWFDATGNPRPDYALYTDVLDHLGTQAFGVTLSGLGKSVYGIDTIAPSDQGRRDLLVVNDNITQSVAFQPQFAENGGGAPVEVWSWNGSIHSTKSNNTVWVEPFTPTPVPHDLASGLPATYTLPPQSMVLFESYPVGGAYVRIHENGVPAPTEWYTTVASHFYGTTADNLSLLLPAGSYAVGSVAIPLPIGGKEYVPSERLAPFVPSPLEVAGGYANTTIAFVPQWRVNVSATPDGAGSVTPVVDWWNASEPLDLTVTAPAVGYAFAGWTGWGPGSYNGTNRSITIVPTGRITEKARFVAGEQVQLVAEGLPAGTPWSVTVRGFEYSSTTSQINVYEPVGAYGFEVAPIPGYRSLPTNGGFTVTGAWNLVVVRFVALTPPPPEYAVTFHITGLSANTPIAITVRGSTERATGAEPVFDLINGSYAFQVGYVAGYHTNVTNKTFYVGGGPLTVEVPFVPTVYRATWEAQGVRSGLTWSVALDALAVSANAAWASAWLPNGSYAYALVLPANFTATPLTGVVEVDGADTYLYPSFSLVEFALEFRAAGMAASQVWSVRLGNATQWAWAASSSFMAPNGTYTFDIHPPSGYYAVPSHGNLTVAGPSPSVLVQFLPSSLKPSDALVAQLSWGAASVSLWIGGSIVVGFVGLRRWRRRGG